MGQVQRVVLRGEITYVDGKVRKGLKCIKCIGIND